MARTKKQRDLERAAAIARDYKSRVAPYQSRVAPYRLYPKMPPVFPGFPPPPPVQEPITLQGLPPIILSRIARHMPDFESLESFMVSCRKLYYVVISTPNILRQISRNYFPIRCIQALEMWRRDGMTIDAREALRGSFLSTIPQLSFVTLEPRKTELEDYKGDPNIGAQGYVISSAEVRRMKSDYWKVRCIAALCLTADLIIKSIDSQCAVRAQFEAELNPSANLERSLHEFKKQRVEAYLTEYHLVMNEMLAHRITPEEFSDYFRSDGRFAIIKTNQSNLDSSITASSPCVTSTKNSQNVSFDLDCIDYSLGDVRTTPNSPAGASTELGDSSFLTNLSLQPTHRPKYDEQERFETEQFINAFFIFLLCFRDHQSGPPPQPRYIREQTRDGNIRTRWYQPAYAERLKQNLVRLTTPVEYNIIASMCDITNKDKAPEELLDELLKDCLMFAVLDVQSELKKWDEDVWGEK